jgi:hypothetical protein
MYPEVASCQLDFPVDAEWPLDTDHDLHHHSLSTSHKLHGVLPNYREIFAFYFHLLNGLCTEQAGMLVMLYTRPGHWLSVGLLSPFW